MIVIGIIFISLIGTSVLSGTSYNLYKRWKRKSSSVCFSCIKNRYKYTPMVSNYEPKDYKPIEL